MNLVIFRIKIFKQYQNNFGLVP